MGQNVLVIGQGGREHAIAWKLRQSPRVNKLFVAPGNGGTRNIADNIPINTTDIVGLIKFVQKNKVDFTVVGPEDPLDLGIVNAFQERGLRIFGPTCQAAKIETSKVFSKQLMQKVGIQTAPFQVFQDYHSALMYIREQNAPMVVKVSGPALGKGACVCKTTEAAEKALKEFMLYRVFGEAGNEVVIEEFVDGQEISVHAFCDGKTFCLLPPAQDHKPIGNNDVGPNTGGMGIIAPVPWVTSETMEVIAKQVVCPALQELAKGGNPFSGILYPGCKGTNSEFKVLEFNARFGDPETQVYMRLLKTDLFTILEACVDGKLASTKIEWHPGFAACVVVASGGYPDQYKKGLPITGLADAESLPGVVVFHAGTTFDGELKTSGGRVLGVTGMGDTLQEALDRAYEAVRLIKFEGMYYRRDIGVKALAMMQQK